MNEQPLELCPKCNTTVSVRRKLITFIRPWGPAVTLGTRDTGHMTISMMDSQGREQHSGSFLNGYYCDACGLGFVPDSVLREVGLTEREILSARLFA